MKIRHIAYRVEFQGRGAGHIHGVLWLDMKEIRIKVGGDLFYKIRLFNVLGGGKRHLDECIRETEVQPSPG